MEIAERDSDTRDTKSRTYEELSEWFRRNMDERGLVASDLTQALSNDEDEPVSRQYISKLRNKGMNYRKAKEIAEKLSWDLPPLSVIMDFGIEKLMSYVHNSDSDSYQKPLLAFLMDSDPPKYQESTTAVLTSIRPSAGRGSNNDHEILSKVTVPKDWLRAQYPNMKNLDWLGLCQAKGDSMEPTFTKHDTLVVDRSSIEFESDGVYVFTLDNEVYLKRIQRVPLKGVRVISDNNELYPAYELGKEDLRGVKVLGRVVGKWGFSLI